jgi:hypothetical protein
LEGREMESCLKRKLVFGDTEQIEALKRIKRRYEEIEKVLGRKIEGPLQKYRATVEYTRTDVFYVDAPDLEAAKVIADYEAEDCDEFDQKEVYVIKPKGE